MTEHQRGPAGAGGPESREDAELRARLRGADPAASLPPADPDRVARLLEATMRDHTTDELSETRESGTRGRSPLTWAVAAAAVVLIGGVATFAMVGSGDDQTEPPIAGGSPTLAEPSVTVLAAPEPDAGRCMVPNAEALAGQSLAFEGTVTEIADGVVVLEPERFYTGEVTDLVEVQAPASELQALLGAVQFEVDGDYLVSATDGRVTLCGFSGPATDDLRALYDEAFPG
ncbi:hypothetical protein [Nocardioides ferulae]|uniref:hypothetical protein n=1 Tax=Nocardioides ferulae TaxID=2340821 RepID=UPI000EACE4FE|nr:hypothetical protein [Nocardioides ferulae]